MYSVAHVRHCSRGLVYYWCTRASLQRQPISSSVWSLVCLGTTLSDATVGLAPRCRDTPVQDLERCREGKNSTGNQGPTRKHRNAGCVWKRQVAGPVRRAFYD